MKTSLFLASRISLHPESRRLSTGVVIAISGVAIALAVMIVSMSVMLGFKQQIRSRLLAFQAPLVVRPISTDHSAVTPAIEFSTRLRELIAEETSAGSKAFPVAMIPAILKTPDNFAGVMVKGVSGDNPLELIRENIVEGTMPDYSADSTLYHIMLSRRLAGSLGVSAGDNINAFFTDNNAPRQRRLKVTGIFDTHFTEFDKSLAFGNIEMMRRLHRADSLYATAIEISTDASDDEIDMLQRTLSDRLIRANYAGTIPQILTVDNIHYTAAQYFNWLALLDTNVIVIMAIMMLVSGLTLVSSLYIIVLERVNMIGILKALGAVDAIIRRVFILVTLRLVITGLITGNIIGLGMIYLQKYLNIISLNPEAYYLDSVPVDISLWWILAINSGVIIIATLVLILPSRIISSIEPAKSIKFE